MRIHYPIRKRGTRLTTQPPRLTIQPLVNFQYSLSAIQQAIGFVVVYLRDSSGDESLDLVEQHRLVGELDERLGAGEGEGAEAGAVAAHQDERLHVAQLQL